MRAGKLNNKAQIFTPATAQNSFGEVESTFVSLGVFACSATTKPRRESTTDESSVSKTEFDLRFRYYAALAILPRSAYIVLNGLTLEINSVANVQLNNREIQMICEERS